MSEVSNDIILSPIKEICEFKETNKINFLRKKKKKISHENSNLIESNKKYLYKTGRWTLDEHKKFINALFLFGNNWKQIKSFIGTRSCPQARSHAQKFFVKLHRSNLLKLKIDERLSSVKILLDYVKDLENSEKENLIQKLYEIHCDDVANINVYEADKNNRINPYNLQIFNKINMERSLNSNPLTLLGKEKKEFIDNTFDSNQNLTNIINFNNFCKKDNESSESINKTLQNNGKYLLNH